MTRSIERVSLGMELGECPLWDHRTNQVYWVDIIKCELFAMDWRSRKIKRWPLPSLGGGLALLGERDILVAAQTGLFAFSPDLGTYQFLTDPEPDTPDNRLNEGKADHAGNFWIGSICTLGRKPQGALYRVDKNRQITKLLSDICIPNSLVFLDDDALLFTDSHLGLVWKYRYDPDRDNLVDQTIFVDDSNEDYIPDGGAYSDEGVFFSAKFGGGCVKAYNCDGQCIETFATPATQVTSCAFVGPERRHLAVTTAKRLLSAAERDIQTTAGDLFIFETDRVGRAEPVCLMS